MAAVVENNVLPPINGAQNAPTHDCSETQGIYNGKFTDRSPFLTPVSIWCDATLLKHQI